MIDGWDTLEAQERLLTESGFVTPQFRQRWQDTQVMIRPRSWTVTQATSRTTGVTLNAYAGQITLVSAAGSTAWASFTVTNDKVKKHDCISLSQQSGTDLYRMHVTNVTDGSFRITFATTAGTTTEQPIINFRIGPTA